MTRGPVARTDLERVLTDVECAALFQPTKYGRPRALESVVDEALHGVYRPWGSQNVRRRRLADALIRDLADVCGVRPGTEVTTRYLRCLNDPRAGEDPAEGPPHPPPTPGDRYCRLCHQAWGHVGMDQATAVNLTGFRA
jgi:hypothetical protein